MTAGSLESEQRLQHSPEGLRRLTQIESAQIHIYVEGKNGDRYYYAKILADTVARSGLKAEFHLSREIPGHGEGKSKCLHFHDFLSEKRELVSTLEGKCTVNCFILDKDVDDLTGELRNCQHVIYTRHYCVENHIVTESDVADALAAAIGMDPQQLMMHIGDQTAWLAHCCERWKEWVALCIVAKVSDCRIKNFGVYSAVNRNITDPADDELVRQFIREIAHKLELSESTVTDRYLGALQVFRALQTRGEQDRLFKGKWYAAFLSELGRRLVGGVDEKAIWSALCGQVSTTHANQEIFKDRLTDLITLCSATAP